MAIASGVRTFVEQVKVEPREAEALTLQRREEGGGEFGLHLEALVTTPVPERARDTTVRSRGWSWRTEGWDDV